MKIYEVGGAVRDRLLGLEPKDIDYVVVGGTEDEMLGLGYQRVGASFPVFLHPADGCEYALARKERKTGVGYNGFDVVFDSSVTLEEDLSRRDLTINAMARDLETGEIIDPFGGQKDLKTGTLRHVSEAFAEDPVRVLRAARFSARYGFTVSWDTIELMAKIAPELNHVPQERIWAEFEKGLMEKYPIKMFWVLHGASAFEVDALKLYAGADEEMLSVITEKTPLRVRFAAIASNFVDQNDYERHKIPTECSRVAHAFNTVVYDLVAYNLLRPEQKIKMMDHMRAFSSPDLMLDVLDVFLLSKAKGIAADHIVEAVGTDYQAAKTVDAAQVAASCVHGKEIREKIIAARVAAMLA